MAGSDIKTPRVLNPMQRLGRADTGRTIITASDKPNKLSRYHGGHRRNNHVYISGYWYFLIIPPDKLFNGDPELKKRSTQWMLSTAESFTPPTRTLKKVESAGMGGMKSYYVAGQDISREFTITFKEYQELPIMTIIQNWTSIVDPNTGVSPLKGNEYIPANYKGEAFAALCKPTIGNRITSGSDSILSSDDIEQLFYFTGVVPKSLPLDSLASDIANNDTLSISVPFSFDGAPLLKDTVGLVDSFISNFMSATNAINPTYSQYTGQVKADNAPGTRSK